MKDFIIVILIFCSFLLFFLFLIFGGMMFQIKIACPKFGEAVHLKSKYVLFGGGCFVQTEKNQWIQKDNYWNSPML